MLTIMAKGGPLMWFILISAIGAIAVFFERLFHYHRAQIHTQDFVNGILNSLKRGNISEAVATCKNTAGPVAQVVEAAVNNHDRARDEIREAVQDTARTEVTRLERNLPILVTIAQVAPLIGLVVAIPSYVAYNYLVSRVQNLVLDMEQAANEIVQYLARKEEGVEPSAKVVEIR
jgi:biopolymer transport protein ExbB